MILGVFSFPMGRLIPDHVAVNLVALRTPALCHMSLRHSVSWVAR